jgi:hypothetical protein
MPGDATIAVTAEDGVSKSTYTISFEVPTSVTGHDVRIFTLFPNPAGDYINILLNAYSEKQVDISIYDVLGNLQITKKISLPAPAHEIRVDTSHLINGVYIFESGGDVKTRIKFLIQR